MRHRTIGYAHFVALHSEFGLYEGLIGDLQHIRPVLLTDRLVLCCLFLVPPCEEIIIAIIIIIINGSRVGSLSDKYY